MQGWNLSFSNALHTLSTWTYFSGPQQYTLWALEVHSRRGSKARLKKGKQWPKHKIWICSCYKQTLTLCNPKGAAAFPEKAEWWLALTWAQLFNLRQIQLQRLIDPCQHVMSTQIVTGDWCWIYIHCHLLRYWKERKGLTLKERCRSEIHSRANLVLKAQLFSFFFSFSFFLVLGIVPTRAPDMPKHVLPWSYILG